jgi:hypothetical protein
MKFEKAEDAEGLTEKNRRLEALVGELLKKNEGLRQQLLLSQQPGSAKLEAPLLS